MSWDEDMVGILRVMVNDPESSVYTDARLEQLLLVGAFQVCQELDFSHDFVVNFPNETITPDPTEEATRDDSFVNLACLKAACIADRGGAILAARQAIAVKDGASAIDLRGNLQGKLRLLEKGGWCAVYQDAKLEYLTNASKSIAGAAIMTPFRLYAYGGYTPRERY